MKKNTSLVEAFTDVNKEIVKVGFVAEPRDVYLAYCALALCTIADKMTDTKPEGRPCDDCRHNIFPDGDAECCACSNYYDSKYESREEEK